METSLAFCHFPCFSRWLKKQLWIISFLNGLARLSQHFWNGPKIRSNNNMFMWVNGHYIPTNDQISVLNKR